MLVCAPFVEGTVRESNGCGYSVSVKFDVTLAGNVIEVMGFHAQYHQEIRTKK